MVQSGPPRLAPYRQSLPSRTDSYADSPGAEEEVEIEEEGGIPLDGDVESHAIVVALLTAIQFFLGAFYTVIMTGYYSLARLIFTKKESAMSSVKAAVGIGFIIRPIFSSSGDGSGRGHNSGGGGSGGGSAAAPTAAAQRSAVQRQWRQWRRQQWRQRRR